MDTQNKETFFDKLHTNSFISLIILITMATITGFITMLK